LPKRKAKSRAPHYDKDEILVEEEPEVEPEVVEATDEAVVPEAEVPVVLPTPEAPVVTDVCPHCGLAKKYFPGAWKSRRSEMPGWAKKLEGEICPKCLSKL